MTSRWVRTLAIWISIAELVILILYYWPLVWSVPWFDLEHVNAGDYNDNYVSDLLFNDVAYRTLVSVLVALQLCICAVFAIQLNRQRLWSCIPVMALELFTLCVAWVGWVCVTSMYMDSDGHMTMGHVLGAGLFIAACALYFVLMMVNVFVFYPNRWSRREWAVFSLAAVCFVLASVVGCIFIASFFTRRVQFGWMFEHAAFILFIAAQLWLFIVDGWLEEDCEVRKDASPWPSAIGGVRINKVVFGS
jgi:hypothetical protein